MLFLTNSGSSILQNGSCTASYDPSHKTSKQDEQDMWGTAGDVRTNTSMAFSYGLLLTEAPVLADQDELTIKSVRTLYASETMDG